MRGPKYKNREVQTIGSWWIATAQSYFGFVAWAKRSPIRGDSPLTEPDDGDDVWFEFGDTRAEVLDRMKNDLGLSEAKSP